MLLSKTIVCDIDGPLTKNEEFIIEKCRKATGEQITKTDIGYTNVKLPSLDRPISIMTFLDEDYYSNVEATDGAFSAIRELKKDNVVILTTARFQRKEEMPGIVNITLDWIKKNYYISGETQLPLKVLATAPEKRKLFLYNTTGLPIADYYIDDNPQTIMDILTTIKLAPLLTKCKVILFQKEYNKHITLDSEVPQFVILKNWTEILEYIKADKSVSSPEGLPDKEEYGISDDGYDMDDENDMDEENYDTDFSLLYNDESIQQNLLTEAEDIRSNIGAYSKKLVVAADVLENMLTALIDAKNYYRIEKVIDFITTIEADLTENLEDLMDDLRPDFVEQFAKLYI